MIDAPLVELRNIEKAFGGVRAVAGVSVNLYAGEVVAVLGHNGAGKSTLMKMLAGAYPIDQGEIRICVEAGLPLSYLWRRASARERAIALFAKLGVWDTEQNNGVLIYLLLAEHAIEIVADRGLQRAVPPDHWDKAVAQLGACCRAGRHEEGLLQAIAAAEAVLMQHFPAPAESEPRNELPDRPVHA